MGGICRQGPLQCFSSPTRMAWLASLHNWSYWGRGNPLLRNWWNIMWKFILTKTIGFCCSFWCWNQRGTVLSTRKISLERERSTYTILKDTPSILGRKTGPDTNLGNPLRPSNPLSPPISWYSEPIWLNKCCVLCWSLEVLICSLHCKSLEQSKF